MGKFCLKKHLKHPFTFVFFSVIKRLSEMYYFRQGRDASKNEKSTLTAKFIVQREELLPERIISTKTRSILVDCGECHLIPSHEL